MFSNGTEYTEFLSHQCLRCTRYVDWEKATEKKPTCKIEQAINDAMGDETKFPYASLKENPHMSRYDCLKFRDKDEIRLIKSRPRKTYAPTTQTDADELLKNFMVLEESDETLDCS